MYLYHILDAMSKGRRWPKVAICNFTSSLRGCVDYFQEGLTPTCEGWSITGTSQATDLRYKHIFYTALYICLCEGWSISFGPFSFLRPPKRRRTLPSPTQATEI